LTVSLLLPPKSGRIPIASFCVEHGRWTGRAFESAGGFSTAAAVVPSHDLKLAMQAPLAKDNAPSSPYGEINTRQIKVWDSVRRTQDQLSNATGADVRAQVSASSLQLALENEKLVAARDDYVKALAAAGETDGDVIGFMFAINGRLNSGDAYLSNGLFRKMWPKLLQASATEAIGHRNESNTTAPALKTVQDFIAAADAGKTSARPLDFGMTRVLHEADQGFLIEASLRDGWVHRGYLVK
jgi:hypothetical protein